MVILAILSLILGIAFSIVYRAMGNEPIANRLLAISIIVLVIGFVFVLSVWGIVLQSVIPYWESLSFF